jgi:hypothetical protein
MANVGKDAAELSDTERPRWRKNWPQPFKTDGVAF